MSQKHLTILCTCIAIPLMMAGCAKPLPVADRAFASNSIRAAQIAGAETYAPAEYEKATASFEKAGKLLVHERPERAQKLLELATAHAELAKTISEAEHAEASLRQLQTASSDLQL